MATGSRGRRSAWKMATFIASVAVIAGSLLVAQATIVRAEGKGKGAATAAGARDERAVVAADGGRPDDAGTRGSDGTAAQTHGADTHPPGNNGTVKIDGEPFDVHPDNEPHPGCVFQIDLSNYDEGDLDATYSVVMIPPTGGDEIHAGSVFIGEDPNGGGNDDIDAQVTVDLTDELADSGVDPHPLQGYHLKLTVHAEGSIGSDVKHKVFWLECAPPTVGGVITPTSPGPNPVGSPVVLARRSTREGPEVLGVQFARTGGPILPLLFFGLALIASGASIKQVGARR